MEPPLVFVPGMMLDDRMYSEQIAALRPQHRTTVADISRSDSIEAMAADLLATAPSRFALVGLSLGGIVALEVCRRARDRVTHLALLDTTPHADLVERGPIRLEQIAAAQRGDLAQILETSLMPTYLARRTGRDPLLLESIRRMGVELGPDVFCRQSLALMRRRDSLDLLASIGCPALVLCGREDRLCSVQVHAAMADAMPRADLVVLAETGHLSSMEEPAGVTAALLRLLRRH